MKDNKLIYDDVEDNSTHKGKTICRQEWYNPYRHLNELFRIPAELHNEYRSYQIAYKAIRDAQEKAQITALLKHHFKSK